MVTFTMKKASLTKFHSYLITHIVS